MQGIQPLSAVHVGMPQGVRTASAAAQPGQFQDLLIDAMRKLDDVQKQAAQGGVSAARLHEAERLLHTVAEVQSAALRALQEVRDIGG